MENWRKYMLKEATTNSKLGKKNNSVDVTTTSDLADKIAPDVASVIKNSYAALGGFPGAETPEGVKHQFTNFYVSDVDEDPEVDIAITYHDRGGPTKKASAIATDGGPSAKREIRGLMSELFKKPGFWAEVSGAPANIAIKKLNLPFVSDPELVEWLVSFGGKRETGIEWLGSNVSNNLGADGWYSRPLQGKNTTKIIIGNITRELIGLK
jgi:hypothetical protein